MREVNDIGRLPISTRVFEDEFCRDRYSVLVHRNRNHKEVDVNYQNPTLETCLTRPNSNGRYCELPYISGT